MQIFRKIFVRFGKNKQNLRDLIPRKRRKRNASLTTRALDKEDPDEIRGNGHTFLNQDKISGNERSEIEARD